MQAVATMDHDSFADFERAARAAARSKRIRQWVLGVAGIAVSWLAAYVKGWEASIVYLPRMERVEKRIGAIEDAGVIESAEIAEAEALATKQRLEEHVTTEAKTDRELEIERWRGWLRSMINDGAALDRAQRQYQVELDRGYPPHIAADRALGWSRPPGR